jgi:predicted ArsR family transcriptional regulator
MSANLAFDFDAHAHARRSDPETSHVAARRTREFAGGHIATILACLHEHGPQTVDQIAGRTRLNSQQVNKRLPDMEKAGLAAPTGFTRLSASGRPERVWGCV